MFLGLVPFYPKRDLCGPVTVTFLVPVVVLVFIVTCLWGDSSFLGAGYVVVNKTDTDVSLSLGKN